MTATEERTIPGHARIVGPASEDRAEWLAERRQGIGGSDAAAICGQDRWRSPFEVFLEKSGAPMPEDEDSEPAEWGRRLEPVVRDAVAERTGLTIRPVPWLLAHPVHDWMRANVDGFAHCPERGDGVYEGKTASHWVGDQWGYDLVPDAYLIQGLHYLGVSGLDYVCFGVLIAGQRLEIRWVERDDEAIAHLIQVEAAFMDRIRDGRPPEPDGSMACTDLLAHLWDVRPGSIETFERDAVSHLLAERAEAAAAESVAAESKAAAENRLKAMLGDAERAIDPDGAPLFSWSEVTARRLDSKALKLAHPDIYDAFVKESTHRRFHVPKGMR